MTMPNPDKPELVAVEQCVLMQAATEYAAEFDKTDWCMRVKFGKCQKRSCLVGPDGKLPATPIDPDSATCARFRLQQAIDAALNAAPEQPRVDVAQAAREEALIIDRCAAKVLRMHLGGLSLPEIPKYIAHELREMKALSRLERSGEGR